MPRRPRFATGGYVFHVLNRATGRKQLFAGDGDYLAFQKVLNEAGRRVPMRLLAYCIMPNHFHLVLWPRGNDDLSEFMRWFTVTHTRRWQEAHGTIGTGPVYQADSSHSPSRRINTSTTCAATSNAIRCGRIWFAAQKTGAGRVCGKPPSSERTLGYLSGHCRDRRIGLTGSTASRQRPNYRRSARRCCAERRMVTATGGCGRPSD